MQGRREQRTRGRRQIQRHRLVRSSCSGASERASGSSSSGAWGRRGRTRSMRKPELCLGFISSSCVHKDEQWPEPGVMAMARLSSSPPRRILLFILLVFLLAFVPFSAGQTVWKYLFSSWFSFFGFWFCFFGFLRRLFSLASGGWWHETTFRTSQRKREEVVRCGDF